MAAAVQNLYADNYGLPWSEASASGIVVARPFIFDLANQTNPLLSATSTIKLMQLPGANLPGFTLLGFTFYVPDLDSSTNVVLQLGDNTTADVFLTTTLMGTIGRVPGRVSSGGVGVSTVVGAPVIGSLPKTYTAANDLVLTIQAGPTTATTGIIQGYAEYTQWPMTSF